ncbi:MAG: chorismate mutase [Gammaproteobacteria bacterium]|nr:chorismate mutase [Gammaproteobacteria bacterium]
MKSAAIPVELLEARKEIDRIDRELVNLLADRFRQTHKVGILKAANSLQAVDAERETQKIAELRKLCESNNLNPDLVTELFTRIMLEVVNNHRQLAAPK